MTIDLPVDLERFVHDEVQAGRYPSEQEVIRAALEQLRAEPAPRARAPGRSAPCDDAELLDQAVEHAMRVRERRSWGSIPVNKALLDTGILRATRRIISASSNLDILCRW